MPDSREQPTSIAPVLIEGDENPGDSYTIIEAADPVVLRLAPDWDDPDGVDIPAAIALWSPALGCLLEKLSRTTSCYWPMPLFLVYSDGSPDFGDIPEFLKYSIEAWWEWYEKDDQQYRYPDTRACLRLPEHQRRSIKEIDRENHIEFLAYDLFDAMIAPGKGYQLKYLPAADPSADWRPFSASRLRMLNRCDKDLPRSTVTLDGSAVLVRVFRATAQAAEPASTTERRATSRGGRPPKYDWEGFHNEITRIASDRLARSPYPRRTIARSTMSDTPSVRPITVTVATALAVTGLGCTKFYELVKEGLIRTVAIGRRTLVIFADLEKLAAIGGSGK